MASKSKERKKNRVTKAAGKPAEAEDDRAARRAALMKNKLTAAMEDPLMRSQIVAAIRAMMKEPR